MGNPGMALGQRQAKAPADKRRALNIPPGRVAQRLQAFQSRSSSPTTISRETPRAPVSTPLDPPPPQLSPTPLKGEVTQPDAPRQTQEVKQEAGPQKYDEMVERGRALQRASDPELTTEGEDQVDDVLEDVRSRLYSVQNIVRRERSGSSQARDELMYELGSMLDNAIATTLSPLTRSPRVPPRSPSSRRPSPIKQPLPQASISRSVSLKPTNTTLTESRPTVSSPSRSPSKTPTRVPPPERANALPNLLHGGRGPSRHRQTSEPLAFVARRTGFPLASPVRERALLWESMSSGTTPPHSTSKSGSHTAHFRPASPRQQSPKQLMSGERSTPATPPISLALPQLLEAEKAHEQARLPENVTPPSKTEESQRPSVTDPEPEPEPEPDPDLDLVSRASTADWLGQLGIKEVGVGTPTVQETPSFAQAAEKDEHYQKPRPSVIKTTIRDLLTATRRRVSGRNSQAQPPPDDRDNDLLVRESKLRGSIADLETVDAQHLPPLQATPDEVANILSSDGT